jgi:PHP family Zn ribbon phosphoesterase
MRRFRGDLHIHTCLSPCADLSMVPRQIVSRAKSRSLDVIAICDHNSAENVVAVRKAGEKEELSVIGGIEITSQEEVHLLALFDSDEGLFLTQEIVYENLPGQNDERSFGEQLVIDEDGEIVDINERLLIGATTLVIEKIVETVHKLGGIAVASHIDRQSYSVISQLGFVPEGLALDALEVSPRSSAREMAASFPWVNEFPVITCSDAHYLEDIGRGVTSFVGERPDITELSRALRERSVVRFAQN